jgi:predicted peptidase
MPSYTRAIATSKVTNLIVDDFKQFEYKDPKTKETLKYNLFVPKNYDKNKFYPLVLFMHDAGATSTETTTTLVQGLGAVVWASPSDQSKHESFVLAPQYSTQVVNDNSEASDYLDTTVNLVNWLTSQYSIDRNRLYTTGQSGGAMMSIAMDIRYPDLFAASFIVAGQWDPKKVKPLAKDKLWIVVSEGDLKAYPGQNAIAAVLEQEGAKVSRAVWDGQSTATEFAAAVKKMETEGNAINYVALKKGTVVPPGQQDNGGGNHINTWRIAYTIEGIRDWIFKQYK